MMVYVLTATDAEQINRRRTTGESILARLKLRVAAWIGGQTEPEDQHFVTGWPAGAQAHIGNEVKEGDQFPAMVVKVKEPLREPDASVDAKDVVNLQVFLDGNDVFWAQNISPDESKNPKPGTYHHP